MEETVRRPHRDHGGNNREVAGREGVLCFSRSPKITGLPQYSIGYVDLLTFAILSVTTIPLARPGVRFAHSCSGRNLQIMFAGVLILIGGMMLVSG
jgi:uncharacterized membrane protein YfcA